MANDDHVAEVLKGAASWNAWREKNPHIAVPNLRGADFSDMDLNGANFERAELGGVQFVGTKLEGAKFFGADLSGANLRHANLRDAHLFGVSLHKADLFKAHFIDAILASVDLIEATLIETNLAGADLSGAKLMEAKLHRAILRRANLIGTNLTGAELNGASLKQALLVDTNLSGADLTDCEIYGISAWNLKLEGAKQQDLVITHDKEPKITVDNIEVAQFVYLLLHNEKIRDVIDTIGKKGVLLLGRFTEGRIEVLERLRDKLRSFGFVPMVFNFDKPETKDITETVRLLANLSHFVVVDITNPRSAPLELQATVPDYMIPFIPILQEGEEPFGMFVDLQNKYDWMLEPVLGYSSVDRLIEAVEDRIVKPAETKFNELLVRRTKQLRVETI